MDRRVEMTKFSIRLKELMEKNNVSVRNVASTIGLSFQALYKYLDGSLLPNIEVLYRLSRCFCVSADYMLGGDDNEITSNPLELTLSELKSILDKITPKSGQDPKVKIIKTAPNGDYELFDILNVGVSEEINCGGFRDLYISLKPHEYFNE